MPSGRRAPSPPWPAAARRARLAGQPFFAQASGIAHVTGRPSRRHRNATVAQVGATETPRSLRKKQPATQVCYTGYSVQCNPCNAGHRIRPCDMGGEWGACSRTFIRAAAPPGYIVTYYSTMYACIAIRLRGTSTSRHFARGSDDPRVPAPTTQTFLNPVQRFIRPSRINFWFGS